MSAEVELSKRGDDGLTTRLVALVVTVAVLVTGAIAFRRHDPASVATALAPQAVSSADVLRGQDLVYSCWIELEAQRDLCLVAGDGSGDINLTNTPDISEVWPAWSSDGTRLAFVREQNSGEMNIWQPRTGGIAIADVPPTDELFAGATIDIRSTSFPGFMPSWKPSSSSAPSDKILYSRHTDVNDIHNRSEIELHIAIVEPDGSIRDQGRLANMGGQHVDGTWRDAYSVLATYRKGSASGGSFAAVSDVFEMDPIPGKENRKELTHAFASVEGALEADLSADGRRMTFIRCGNVITLSAQCAFDARRLVVADPDGSSESTVFDDRSGPRNPRWSPDGTLIAYSNKAGVKVYALDTNVDIVVPGSDLYDVTPSWRPRDVGDLGVVAVDESGRPNSLFDEGENVHARVNPLSGASSLRVCLLPAVSVVPEPMPGTGYCEPDPVAAARGEVRSPTLTVHDILPDPVPSRVTIDMFTPSATRWQIGADHLDAFGNLMLREVSRPFGVTCVGGSCAVFPYLGTAARYRGYADLIDAFNTLISVTCFSIELVLLGMTALSAGFSGSLAGLGISMVAGFAIQQIVGEVLGNLASSVMGSALSRVVGDTFEEGILDSRTTQSESAWANYEYLQLDPTASPEVQELVVDAVNDADEQLDTADKRLRRV
ncbi:MAG TPA: hypothetical protein VGK49_03135, partial [Ilumatobacteraceae bacterium]